MIVIIGAGPIGLYLLNKLLKQGIRVEEVIMFDPHSGEYVRPGQLDENIFKLAEQGLGVALWPLSSKHIFRHIKEFERLLHFLAKDSSARIEKKRFIRLHQDATMPGIIVADDKGIEELVEADCVFDCSGQSQVVIHDVNRICKESLFKSEAFMDIPVSNHFIANVRLDLLQHQALVDGVNAYTKNPEGINPLAFSRSIEKLRGLGWTELKFPRCLLAPCGKDESNKVCIYLQAPDALAKENHDKWVQAVLACYTDPIHFEHLSPTRKYAELKDKSGAVLKEKLRFTPFKMRANALREVGYQGKDLPPVVALGDAQIDFDYALGHGLYDGLLGVDILFNHVEIVGGKLTRVDWKNYTAALQEHHQQHKDRMINEAKAVEESFAKAQEVAKLQLAKAVTMTSDEHEQEIFKTIIGEIEARQSYANSCRIFYQCHDSDKQLKLVILMIDLLISKLNNLQEQLLKAHNGLPENFAKERTNCANLLITVADDWSKIAAALQKKSRLVEAAEAYRKALTIYNSPALKGHPRTKEMVVSADLTLVMNELEGKLKSKFESSQEKESNWWPGISSTMAAFGVFKQAAKDKVIQCAKAVHSCVPI